MFATFILKDGSQKIVEFSEGENLLKLAGKYDIKLSSMCEGNGVCGGCHVYIKTPNLLDPPSEKEENGLDRARGVTLESRLACQVTLTEKSDGLIIEIP